MEPEPININNISQLIDWDNSNCATATLRYDLRITTTTGFPINIDSASANPATFDGNGHTITIASGVESFPGLFSPVGGDGTYVIIIKNLKIKFETGSALDMNSGALISSLNNNSVTINDCAVIGTYTVPSNAGALVGTVIGTSGTSACTITGCYSTGTIGGSTNSGAGGIIGSVSGDTNVYITNCYSIGVILGTGNGGIVGLFSSASDLEITSCYSTGSICIGADANISGGIIGEINNDSAKVTITNCYTSGELSNNSSSGGICGTITDCDVTNIINCYSQHASGVDTGSKKYVGNKDDGELYFYRCGFGNGTWNAGLGEDSNTTGLYDANVWINTNTTPFLLQHFRNNPWSTAQGEYITAEDDDIAFNPSAMGDPHITPLYGSKYDLHVLGPFRLFDNNNIKNRLIINGLSGYGKHLHKKLTYIRKIFIYHNGKTMVINTGFRGEKASIISNNGFNENNIVISDLPMGNKIIRKCQLETCNYVTKKPINRTHNTGTSENDHYIPELERNQISMDISVDGDNDYKIIVRNVSHMNIHPCQFKIVPLDMTKIVNYSGAVVKETLVSEVELTEFEYKEEHIKLLMQY